VGSRDVMQRVSGRFYMGAGARAQGEGGVQKKQIGTGLNSWIFIERNILFDVARTPRGRWHGAAPRLDRF
jgi:hypothetical protein